MFATTTTQQMINNRPAWSPPGRESSGLRLRPSSTQPSKRLQKIWGLEFGKPRLSKAEPKAPGTAFRLSWARTSLHLINVNVENFLVSKASWTHAYSFHIWRTHCRRRDHTESDGVYPRLWHPTPTLPSNPGFLSTCHQKCVMKLPDSRVAWI